MLTTHLFQTTRAKISAALLFAAMAFAGGTKAYAAFSAGSDCCAPGAACCHPGAACCRGHKAS